MGSHLNSLRTLFLRILALAFTALACGATLSAPVHAQAAPPEFQALDENAVDMSRRVLNRVLAAVSIGPEGLGGLRYGWSMNNDKDRTQYQGYVWFFNLNEGSTGSVVLAGRTISFTFAGGQFVPKVQDGTTLVKNGANYTLTLSDGTVAVYVPVPGHTDNSAQLKSLTAPSGESQTLYYTIMMDTYGSGDVLPIAKVTAVTTSFGYQLRIGYSYTGTIHIPASAVVFNMAQENCSPTASSCSLTATWPTAQRAGGTYYGPGGGATQVTSQTSGSNTSMTVTTPAGRTENYNGFFVNSLYYVASITKGSDTWQYQPGGSSPAGPVIYRFDPNRQAPLVVVARWDGRPTQVVSGTNSYSKQWAYNSAGQAWRYIEGKTTEYVYDARGNVAISKVTSISPNLSSTASFPTYCSNSKTCNKPSFTLDPLGRQTDYQYDPTHGGVTTITLPAPAAGQVRPAVTNTYAAYSAQYYNGSGSLAGGPPVYLLQQTARCRTNASCAGTSDELRTVFSYDVTNNNALTQITTRDGTGVLQQQVNRTYYLTGDLKTESEPVPGAATRYYYDVARHITGMIGPDPDGAGPRKSLAQRTTYDADGFVTLNEIGTATSQSDTGMTTFVPQQSVAYTYNAAGRLATEALKAGSTTYALTQYTTIFTTTGTEVCFAQRMNPVYFASLPASACSIGTEGSFGPDRITKTVYDSIGRPISVTNGFGMPDAATETIAYTSATKTEVTDANANKTTTFADGALRPYLTQYPAPTLGAGSSSTTDYEQLTYNAASNVTARRLRDGTTTAMTYDNLDRVKTVTPYGEGMVTYSYDLLGNPITITRSNDGAALSFAYDGLARLTSEGQQYGTMGYQYDAYGRVNRLTWPDGLFVTYDYDNTSATTAVREYGATSGVGVLAQFAYDDLGRRQSVTYGNGTTRAYAWDPVSRLSGLSIDLAGSSYDHVIGQYGGSGTVIGYNPASQMTLVAKSNDAYSWTGAISTDRPYVANGLNQYSSVAGSGLTYDTRGNLTYSAGVSYSYNKLNQLTSAQGMSLTYDPIGRLTRHTGPSTKRFVYSGMNLASELTDANGILRRYVYGPGVDEPIVWYEGAGTSDRRFLQADERGSTVAVSNQSGYALAVNSYDEYGIPGSGNQGRFQYTGQAWLVELGMYYYKARIYSPTLGRFMQTDPIGYGDGLNLYAYVGNDPVNNTDPTGLYCYNGPYGGNSCANSGNPARPYTDSNGTVGYYWQVGANFYFVPTSFNVYDSFYSDAYRADYAAAASAVAKFFSGKHTYRIGPLLAQCSKKNVFGYFKEAGHSAPGAPAAKENFTARIVLSGGNPISQYVSTPRGQIINATLKGHIFHPGTVDIRVSNFVYEGIVSTETSVITISGEGSGLLPTFNDIFGHSFFAGQAAGAADSCNR